MSDDILAKLRAALPCDVMVAPATIIRKGCPMSTLLLAISRREGDKVRR